MAKIDRTKIYEEVYDVIKTLLIDNKPTYERKNTTFTYTILPQYHNTDASFPQIVLNKAMINLTSLTLYN